MINIMGRGLTRKAKSQPITGLQKICASMLIAIFVCSLIMLMLNAIGMIQTDIIFFQHVLIVVTSVTIGYLFGNNTKIPCQTAKSNMFCQTDLLSLKLLCVMCCITTA